MLQKNENEPLVQREKNLTKPNLTSRGWLKNGNPPGDFMQAPRCGAKGKRTGRSCRQPAMANGRCRLHGGKSTGPITVEGLKRAQTANWKHGEYSQMTRNHFRALKKAIKLMKWELTAITHP